MVSQTYTQAQLDTFLAAKATPAQITAAITGLVNGASTALDTLSEIDAQLAADEGSAAALAVAVGQKSLSLPANAMSANGTAVIGARNSINASTGPVAITLPTPTAVGQHMIIERQDASSTAANAITITGTIRGVANTVVTLAAVGAANEGALYIAESLTSWAIAASIKPKAVLDLMYAPKPTGTAATGTYVDGGTGAWTALPSSSGVSALGWLNATDAPYGAIGDCVAIGDLTFTAGSAVVTSAGSLFTQAMTGKTIALTQAKGTVQSATFSSAAATSSTSFALSASILPGIYLFGSGVTAELLHVRSVTGTSAPYTAYLGQSNVNEGSTQARAVGDTVTRLDVLVTTIASVAAGGGTATLATAPTATSAAEWPRPATPGGTVSATSTAKTGWVGTDNTAAFQRLAAAVPTTGAAVHLPPGRYLKTATITWPNKVHLFGRGGLDDGVGPSAVTQVIDTSTTTDGMLFQQAGDTVEDISFLNTSVYSSAPTAGAGLHFARATQININRVSAISHFNNVVIDEGFYYNITNSHFYDAPNYGLFFTTPTGEENDHGDQSVEGTVISMNYSIYRNGASAVRWESGGGLRFPANKINGREQPVQYKAGTYNYGLDMAIADGVNTVDALVQTCSIENCTSAGIYVHHKGPNNTGRLGNIIVTGNEIGYCGDPIDCIAATVGNIYSVIVTGNVFPGNSGGINMTGVAGVNIGANDWGINPTLMVYLGATTTDVTYDPGAQTVRGDFLTILQDNSVTSGSHGPFGNQRYSLTREILATTSTTTYTNLYSVTVPQYHGAAFEVVIEGNAAGVGPIVLKQRRVITRTTGACTLITVDTDIATDVSAGTQQIELALDITTRPGDVIVRVRLKAGGTATDFAGRCYFKYDGPAYMIRKGS